MSTDPSDGKEKDVPSRPERYEIQCDGRRYEDHPDFTPDLSPETMAKLGVFGGAYFADDLDDNKDIPSSVLKRSMGDKDKTNNAFGVHSGMSREKWDERGWLTEDNPRGWYGIVDSMPASATTRTRTRSNAGRTFETDGPQRPPGAGEHVTW